ncbi:MAG: YaeQ family protein [Halioglobus sp.]|nr:YaeQ family protein [Halioglobus sp.]
MALKPTIYKAQVELADSDRGRFESLSLTLALHPSETLERMAARLLVFCLQADEGLAFTRGLSTAEEPDLWQHSASGEVEHWIEVGQPEEPRLRKACGRAPRVSVYAFGKSGDVWWRRNADELAQLAPLGVWQLDWNDMVALAALLERTVQLSVSVVGGTAYIDREGTTVSVTPAQLQAGPA